MTTPAQREAVARKLREQHLGDDAALAHWPARCNGASSLPRALLAAVLRAVVEGRK